MIPKIIHWCWFGGNPIPDDVKRYLASWQRYCPDYRIICWNEENFDVTQNAYCQEAYEAKKWAFVADYVRLKVLWDYGGFYLDSDVELLKPLDSFLSYQALSGYESEDAIPTGLMAAEPHNEWIGMLLSDYDHLHFRQENGSIDLTTNVARITQRTVERYGIEPNNQKTVFGGGGMVLFPKDYFCPKDAATGDIQLTPHTYAIHHFAGSWLSAREKRNVRIRDWLKEHFGSQPGLRLYRIYHYFFVHKVGHIIHAWNKHIRGDRFDKH